MPVGDGCSKNKLEMLFKYKQWLIEGTVETIGDKLKEQNGKLQQAISLQLQEAQA